MNCPYCTREMENGYLRGNNSYELLWTEEPFKMNFLSRLETTSTFAKRARVVRPIAHPSPRVRQDRPRYPK